MAITGAGFAPDAPAWGDLKIYGLASRGSAVDHAGCLAAGMDGCLTKPVDRQALAEALQAAAGKGRGRPEAQT